MDERDLALDPGMAAALQTAADMAGMTAALRQMAEAMEPVHRMIEVTEPVRRMGEMLERIGRTLGPFDSVDLKGAEAALQHFVDNAALATALAPYRPGAESVTQERTVGEMRGLASDVVEDLPPEAAAVVQELDSVMGGQGADVQSPLAAALSGLSAKDINTLVNVWALAIVAARVVLIRAGVQPSAALETYADLVTAIIVVVGGELANRRES